MPIEPLYFRWAAIACILTAAFGRVLMDLRHPPTYIKPHRLFANRQEWMVRFLAYGLGLCPFVAQLFGWEILPMRIGGTPELAIRGVGVVLMVVAVIGTIWPRYVRLRAWSSPMTSPDCITNHQLVTHGPYRFIRHPYYSSSIVGILGVELALGSYLLFFNVPILIGCMVYVIRREERQLREVYKEEFMSYAAKSWRLFPPIY